jgi:type I restriction enzyme, S subunit
MKVKGGYKDTEVGVIPNDWKVVPIGDLVTEFRGGASLKPSDFTKAGVKVLPKRGVGRTGWLQIRNGDQKYCSPEYAAANYRNQVDETFTIIVLRDLVPSGPSIGLMVQIKDKDTYVLAQGVYGFKIKNSVIPRYLVHLSNTQWYRKLMKSIMVGSTQVHITNTAFKQVQIPLPPLSEQQALVTALSDVDSLITSLDKLIAKKKLIKKAAMQQLLTGNTRLPGFSGEWEENKLGDIAEIVMGQSPSSAHYNTKSVGLPLIQGNADIFNRKTIKRNFTTEVTKLGHCGDILMSVRAPVGEISRAIFDFCIGRGVCAIRFPNDFIYFALIERESSWTRLSKGSTFDSVSSKDVNNLTIKLPKDKKEQVAIADVISDLDTEIVALKQRREKTRLLKKGMMQELLTGRIRLI